VHEISISLFNPVMFAYMASAVLYLCYWVFKKESVAKTASILTLVVWLLHTAMIILRWVGSYELGHGHAPFSNLFESMVFFSWTIALVYLLLERKTKIRSLGAFAVPLAFFALAYCSLKELDPAIKPLLPALKSNWLIAHVITCFLGYAGFAVSCALSVMYLVTRQESIPETPKAMMLDEIIYQCVVIGFILLTAGIVTGAIWADSAWGRYWGWDPKETWSLITWFVYAAFLHSRYMRGWQGKRLAWFSIVGFACVIFTFLGVNLLLSGLHSYATN
jgi:cytochrome c-type biogenesis protein CcsB